MRAIALLCLSIAPLTGCSDFPELRSSDSEFVKAADYPTLQPLGPLRADDEDDQKLSGETGLDSRANALRNRARRLRGDVIDQNTRKRLDQGVVEG